LLWTGRLATRSEKVGEFLSMVSRCGRGHREQSSKSVLESHVWSFGDIAFEAQLCSHAPISIAASSSEYGTSVISPQSDSLSVEEMLDDLRAVVEIESPSLDLDALAASAAALNAMIERLLGKPATMVAGPAGQHLLWSGGGEPKVLVLGHYDTVFPIGSLDARPFTVAHGRATGPGVFDMAAGI